MSYNRYNRSYAKPKNLESFLANVYTAATTVFQCNEISMPASIEVGMGLFIRDVQLILGGEMKEATAYVTVAITKTQHSAIPEFDDPDVIFYHKERCNFVTSGLHIRDETPMFHLPFPILCGQKKLYFNLICVNATASMTVGYKIGFTIEPTSKDQIMDSLINTQ